MRCANNSARAKSCSFSALACSVRSETRPFRFSAVSLKVGRELIEGRESGVDLFERDLPFFHGANFAQTDLAQLARERLMLGGNRANDIDVFEAGLAVETKVRQVLAEESEAFAEKENGDQGEDDDGDERVAAEEGLDALFDGRLRPARCGARRDESAGIGDAFHAERPQSRKRQLARQFL